MHIANARFYFSCFLAARFARGFARVLLRRLNRHHSTNPNPCRRTHLLQRARAILQGRPREVPVVQSSTSAAFLRSYLGTQCVSVSANSLAIKHRRLCQRVTIKVVQDGKKFLENRQILFLNCAGKSVYKFGVIPMRCLVSVLEHF